MHIELYGYLNTLFKYILDQNNVYILTIIEFSIRIYLSRFHNCYKKN